MNFLGREEVFCNFPGCSWVGLLENLTIHLKECELNPDKQPSWLIEDAQAPSGSLKLKLLQKMPNQLQNAFLQAKQVLPNSPTYKKSPSPKRNSASPSPRRNSASHSSELNEIINLSDY